MLRRPATLLMLLAMLGCTACTPVRTVYDSQGNEVKDDEPGGEKDLMSTFEKRFDNDFSEKKNADGVPVTTSGKVSSFQRELDNARKIDKPFATGNFDTGRNAVEHRAYSLAVALTEYGQAYRISKGIFHFCILFIIGLLMFIYIY